MATPVPAAVPWSCRPETPKYSLAPWRSVAISGYTPADPYAYRSDEQGEAARTYTDRVPGTVYPDQEGDRR